MKGNTVAEQEKTKQEKAQDQIRNWQDSSGRYVLPLIVAVVAIWFVLTAIFG
jgi:cell division protein FtsB